jgi:predicted GTPase
VRGRKVIVVDDGPTITHGGMGYGAGYVAAVQGGAGEIVDPRLCAVGDIADVYRKFPHIRKVLPAMGYSDKELADLRATLNASGADVVVAGTPMDLSHLIQLDKPLVRARYDFKDVGAPRLVELVLDFLKSRDLIERAVA